MQLLSVGVIICFVVVVVNSAEDRVLRGGGRSYRHKLRRRSHMFHGLRRGMGILTSYNLSDGVKGMSCNGKRCHHYGAEPKRPMGKPKWVMKVKHTRYLCYSEDVHDCPRFEGGFYRKYTGKAPSGKLNHYQMVVCGKVYMCHAHKSKDCPKVPIIPSVWEEVTKEKAYILDKNSTVILCLASDIEKCQDKFGHGDWKPKDGVDDENEIHWYLIDDGIKYYCKNREKEQCEKYGSGEWKRYCEGEVEECEKKKWEREVDGVTIICVAYSVEDCEGIYNGDWKPSKRANDKNGKPQNTKWYIHGSGGVTFYCDGLERSKCPKELSEGGSQKWEETPPDDPFEDENRVWEQKIRGKTLICVSSDIKFCKRAGKGRWKPSHREIDEDGMPKRSKWEIDTGGAIIYCDAKLSKNCPKIGRGKWGPTDGEEPEDSQEEEGTPMWDMTVDGKLLICVAPNVRYCKKAHPGHWKRCYKDKDSNGVPEKSKWLTIVGKGRLYCDQESSETCPKIKGNIWKKVPIDSDDQRKARKRGKKGNMKLWELKIGEGTFVCVAYKRKDCRKAHKGHWKPSEHKTDDNGVPEDYIWANRLGDAKLYCKSKLSKSCQNVIKGGRWISISEDSDDEHDDEHRKHFPNDKRKVDVGKIAPLVERGGGRFKQSQNLDSAVMLCYGSDSSNCPEGVKWIETKQDVGKEVRNIISDTNIWVLKRNDVYLVCIAEELSSCQSEAEDDEWSIIAGMKAGLWKSTQNGVHTYCETAEKSKCPEEFGSWKLVSMDQWDQKVLAPNKKGNMWRLVSFDFTAFCDAKYKNKCPKFKDYTWSKVFGEGDVDYSAYGKKVRFKKMIDKTLYQCKAKTADACPTLPNNETWEKVKSKVTVEEVLTLFEDIPGFKDSCYSGICKIKNNKAHDPFSE
ncbi:hypothetical protein GE061_017883 [Apolygus lucorum]|uniref:Uncharacterized protein n=1 Tax=Apolygus lucorum TaxID=248454 RepID=A0A8S9XCA6_APOLU|nr:hypothetical protein GE061_017883 [Apolygus lucorum]